MVRLEHLAETALAGDALRLRSLVQDWLAENPNLSDSVPPPSAADVTVRAVAAALVELLAQRRRQPPPAWTAAIGAAPRPIHLVKSAATMPRLRRLCEAESPPPLRHPHPCAPPPLLHHPHTPPLYSHAAPLH